MVFPTFASSILPHITHGKFYTNVRISIKVSLANLYPDLCQPQHFSSFLLFTSITCNPHHNNKKNSQSLTQQTPPKAGKAFGQGTLKLPSGAGDPAPASGRTPASDQKEAAWPKATEEARKMRAAKKEVTLFGRN